MDNLGIYIHIPFCSSICSYCSFYSKVTDEKVKEDYMSAVIRAIKTQPFGKRTVDTIYFGGGTPTTMQPHQLVDILNSIKENFKLDKQAEITLEANPESTNSGSLKILKDAGFNRISFGMQSAVQKELSAIGRVHSAKEAREAVYLAKEAGFKHISADLMLGIPHQDSASLDYSIDYILDMPLDHISVYMLSVDEGTPIAKLDLEEITMDEDQLANSYLNVIDRLEKAGFLQYEISNFAKHGGESRHNNRYWLFKDYLGIGPTAHSFVDGKRFEFAEGIQKFISSSDVWQDIIYAENSGGVEEYAMLRLRLKSGLNLQEYKRLYPNVDIKNITKKLEHLVSEGYVNFNNDTISFTPKGFLLSNNIITELIF